MNENVNTNIQRVLETLGDQIIDVYRRKLYEGGSNASGLLGNSLSCIVKTEDGVYDLYISLQDYWKYVEYDTKPHFPPPQALLKWIEVKPVIPRPGKNGRIPTPKQLAFLIGRHINTFGTTGTHDLQQTKDDL